MMLFNELPPLDSETAMYMFFWTDRKHRRAVTAIAVFLAFLLALVVIFGGIFFSRWWTPAAAPSTPAVQTAAKVTQSLIFTEEYRTIVDCVPSACNVPPTVEIWIGVLTSSLTFEEIGTSVGACTTIGSFVNTTGEGFWKQCKNTYTFTGAGGVDAGTLVAEGLVFDPEGEPIRYTSVWAVTGGTHLYARPSGGVLTTVVDFYTNDEDPNTRQTNIVYVTLA